MTRIYPLLIGLFCLLALPGWGQSIFVGDSICSGDSTFIYVIPDSGRTYTWFDAMNGGNQIGTGDTLWVGSPSTTTTYYAQGQLPGAANFTVGPVNNSFAGGSNYTHQPDGIVFDVNNSVTIDSLYVYPNNSGNVVINIENSSQTNIFTITVPVTVTSPGSKTVIPIGYTIAPGTGYRMNNVGSTVGGLFRNTGGAQYPYTSLPLNITGAINNSTTFYYKFYDWHLSAGAAPDPRVGVTVTVNPNPTVNLGPDINLCQGAAVTLNDPPGLTCLWSNGSTGPTTVLDSAGIYSVICTDSNNCTANDTIELIAVQPYQAGLRSDTTVCVGDSVSICAASAPSISYNWSNGDTSSCTTFNSAGNYSLLAIDNFGCSYFDTTEVIAQSAPTAAWSVDSSACPTFQFMDMSTDNPNSTIWTFGDGSSDSVPNPSHTYASNGIYTVTLLASNACGTDSSTQMLEVPCLVGQPEPASTAWTIFPNPNNGRFQIRADIPLTGLAQLRIWSLEGRLIRHAEIAGNGTHFSTEVDLRQEGAGIYLIRLDAPEGSWSAKVQVGK